MIAYFSTKMIVFLPISVNIGQCAFEALAQIVHKIHSLGDMNHDKHGRSSLLSSYVSYAFNTPGSGTPVPSPNDSPSKYLIRRNFVGRNFRHQRKNSSLSPDKKFRTIKIKVSLNELQVNLRRKHVI